MNALLDALDVLAPVVRGVTALGIIGAPIVLALVLVHALFEDS